MDVRRTITALRRNVTLSAFVASTVVALVGLIALGGPRTHGGGCPATPNPTAEKNVAPSQQVALNGSTGLSVHYGYARGTKHDDTELLMKSVTGDVDLPEGPIAVSHSLVKRADGPSSHVSDEAVTVTARATGSRLRIRLCVDTRRDAALAPGRYEGRVSIDDVRFAGHEAIPVEVTLQTPYVWWVGAPLTAAVLLSGVWFAGRAADQSLGGLKLKVALPLFALAVGAAAKTFQTEVLADQAFGYDPIVQWGALAWAIGSAVLAAATGAFGTEKLSTGIGGRPRPQSEPADVPAEEIDAEHRSDRVATH